MAGPSVADLFDRLSNLGSDWGQLIAEQLLSPGSTFSIGAIALCIGIAAAATLANRSRAREVRFKVLVRALFPRRIVRTASGRTDLAFAFFNIFLWALLFGWAVISTTEVGRLTEEGLAALFGPSAPTRLAPIPRSALMTVAVFLAYELGYWLNHYLAHRVAFLWEFHKVHHAAESLSPITNFRVHPVYTVIFYNIVAVTMGLTQGALSYGLGQPAGMIALGGTNLLMLAAGILLVHLQHSHLWISFSGRMGRILLSPAHHQIHHSADPAHHDRNFGSALAIFDHLFGTLYVPSKRREKLTFGVPDLGYDPHTLRGGFLMPIVDAGKHLKFTLPPVRAKRLVPPSSQ